MNPYELLVSLLFQKHTEIKTIPLFGVNVFYSVHALSCIFMQKVENLAVLLFNLLKITQSYFKRKLLGGILMTMQKLPFLY